MKFIPVVKIEKELNDEALLRLKETTEKSVNSEEDEFVEEHSYEWYINLGIEPPDHLKPKKQSNKIVVSFRTDPSDFVIRHAHILLNLEEVEEFEEDTEFTIVYYKTGREITIKENIGQILNLIN